MAKAPPEPAAAPSGRRGGRRASGDVPGATATLEEARQRISDLFGEDHADYAAAVVELAVTDRVRGDFDEALEKLRQAKWILTSTFNDRHPTVMKTAKV